MNETTMQRVTYDEAADACRIYLAGDIPPGGVGRTVQATEDVNLDFNHRGQLVGVELLSATVLHPALALRADRIARRTR